MAGGQLRCAGGSSARSRSSAGERLQQSHVLCTLIDLSAGNSIRSQLPVLQFRTAAELPPSLRNVTAVLPTAGGPPAYVLGISHVSKESCQQIEELIRLVKPGGWVAVQGAASQGPAAKQPHSLALKRIPAPPCPCAGLHDCSNNC